MTIGLCKYLYIKDTQIVVTEAENSIYLSYARYYQWLARGQNKKEHRDQSLHRRSKYTCGQSAKNPINRMYYIKMKIPVMQTVFSAY